MSIYRKSPYNITWSIRCELGISPADQNQWFDHLSPVNTNFYHPVSTMVVGTLFQNADECNSQFTKEEL
jgi:hypothetical protein